MTPRPIPDPPASMLLVGVFSLACLASFFAMGAAIAAHLYDRITGGNRDS